jgi:DNA-binding transcriptional regulator LsrR (DeoR family)
MMATTGEQIRAIPEVLSITYDLGRAPAVRAALRAGLVDSLVTHTSLARAGCSRRPGRPS